MTARLHRGARALLGLLLALPAVVVVAIAVAGPWLAGGAAAGGNPGRDPGRVVDHPYLGPVAGLPLGTDFAGRDVWARLLAGGRPLVVIPVLAVVLTAVLGTALGMLAGYRGGLVDAVVSRLDGLFLALPPVLVLLVLLHGWGYNAVTLIVVVVLTGAPFVSRVARAATLQVMRQGYVEQAVGLGEGPGSVLVREILPNIARPILADAGTRLAIAVSLTAAAGFLGFGPDEPNWGAMISQNVEGITLTPWAVVAPAVCLATLAVAANLGLDRFAARFDR